MTGRPAPWSRPGTPGRSRLDGVLRGLALTAVLALPLGLLHARALAEIAMGVVAGLFLLRSARAHDWGWVRTPFAVLALLWWAWLVVCSVPMVGGWVTLAHALAAIRFPLLAIAVGRWVLDTSGRRAALWFTLLASALWIGAECWHQYVSGHDVLGFARYGDGALTGPFAKPRAGPALVLILFPVLLPPLAWLLSRKRAVLRALGWLLLAATVATFVLIGQRMPVLLLGLGLVLAALMLRALRAPVLAALLAGGVLVAALPVVSPATQAKLVQRFGEQMADFRHSDYGEIFARAVVIAQASPIVGYGFDGFRHRCADPATFHGAPSLGIPDEGQNGGVAACNIHPHNYYLEMADDAGVPGVVLFTLLVLAALWRVVRAPPSTLRAGILVALVLSFWPVASTSTLFGLPDAGWTYLILGLGFSLARERQREATVPV